MKEHDQEEIGKLLRDAFAPDDDREGAGPRRDLWPALLRRTSSDRMPTPWYDWVLASGLAGTLIAFPGLLVILAYHI